MSTSFQPAGGHLSSSSHDGMESGGQMPVKTPPPNVSQAFGRMLPPATIMQQQQQQQRVTTSQAYIENRTVNYTPFTIADHHLSAFPESHIRLAKDEKSGTHPSLTRALLESRQTAVLSPSQFHKYQLAFGPGVEGMKGERSDMDEKVMSPLSIVSYQEGSQPSPSPSSKHRQQGLRYQASGNPGDAMLSAINYNENDILHDGGFDVNMQSSLSNLEEGLLSNMAPGPGVRLNENTGPPSFDLFDGDGNVAEPYNMDSLSPQAFTDNNPGFTMADTTGLAAVADSDHSGSGRNDERRSSADSPGPGKGRNKGRTSKAGSPARSSSVQCLTCGKGFSNSSALAKHKLTHSDERKYICPICSKAFKRQDHLNGHMMTHRDKKPFECTVKGCEKSYCDARSLRRHMENHHNQSSAEANTTSQSVAQAESTQAVLPNNLAEFQQAVALTGDSSGSAVYASDAAGGGGGSETGSGGGRILFTPGHTPYSPSPASTPHQSPGYANTQTHYFQFDTQQQQQQQVPPPPPPPPPPPQHFQSSNSTQVWQQEGGVIFVSPAQNSHSPRSGEQSPGYLQQISPISPAPGSPRLSSQSRAPWNQLAFNQPQSTASDLMLKPGTSKPFPLTTKTKKRRKPPSTASDGDENKPVQCSMCSRRFKNIPALNGHMRLHGGYFKKVVKDPKDDKKKGKKELSVPALNQIMAASKLSQDAGHFKQPFQAPQEQQHIQSPLQGGTFILPPNHTDGEGERTGQEQHSPLTPTHPPQQLSNPSLPDQTNQHHRQQLSSTGMPDQTSQHHRHVQQLLQQHIQMQSLQHLQHQQQQIEHQQQQLQQLQEQLEQHFQQQQEVGRESPTSPSHMVVPSSPVTMAQGEVLSQRNWQNPDTAVSIHVPSPQTSIPMQSEQQVQENRGWQEFTPQQEVVFHQQLQTMQDMQKRLQQQQVEQQLQQHDPGAAQVVTMAPGSPSTYPILQQQLMLGLQSPSGESLNSPVEHMSLPTTFSDVLPQSVAQDTLPSSLSVNMSTSDPVFVSSANAGPQNFISGDRQQDLTDAQLFTSVVASIISGQHALPSMEPNHPQFTQNPGNMSDHQDLSDVNLHQVHLPTSTGVLYENRLTENSTDPIMVNNSLTPVTTLEESLSLSVQPAFTSHRPLDSSGKSDDDKFLTSHLHSRPPSEVSPFTFRPVNSEGSPLVGGEFKPGDPQGTIILDRDKYLPPIGSSDFLNSDVKLPSRKRHKSEGVLGGSSCKRSVPTSLATLLQKAGQQYHEQKPNSPQLSDSGEARSTKTAEERNKILQRSKSEDHTFMRPHNRGDDPYYRPRSRTEETVLHRSRTHHDFLSRSDGAGVFRNPSLTVSPIRVKKKNRPAPLIIPPHSNNSGFQSRLRSPRLWDGGLSDGIIKRGNTPPPYTPPPMLSPVRSGSGLFCTLPPRFRPMTPKSAPIAPRLSFARRNSIVSGPVKTTETIEEEPEIEEPPPETDIQPHVNVGPHYQADIPSFSAHRGRVMVQVGKEDLVWDPNKIPDSCLDEDMQSFQEFACSAAVQGNGCNVEYALHILHLTGGNIQDAMLLLMKDYLKLPEGHSLLTYQYQEADIWNTMEIEAYYEALLKCDKDFFLISKEVGSKSVKECVQFYYLWKKVFPDEYKRLRVVRRKKENDELYNLRSRGGEAEQSTNPEGDAVSESDGSTEEEASPRNNNQAQDVGRNTPVQPTASPARSVTPPRASPSPSVVYPCPVTDCSATFTSKQALNSHTKLHGGLTNQSYLPQPPPTGVVGPLHPVVSHVPGGKTVYTTEKPVRKPPRTNVKKPPQPPQFNSDGSIQIFPCKLCGKVFYKVKSRSAHMKSHREVDKNKPRVQPKTSMKGLTGT